MEYKLIEGVMFFDTIYGETKRAQSKLEKLIEDWGHKEKIKKVYVILNNEDYLEFIETGTINSNYKYITFNEESAIEELEYMNL